MRFLLLLFLALASGIGLTLLAENPGYILITREPWSLETSLTMFALGLLLAFIAGYLLVRLIKYLFNAPANIRHWKHLRNRDLAIKDTTHGLAAAINGKWTSAEKLLSKRLENSPQREINLLASAWVAQQNNELQKRDDFIAAAGSIAESAPDDIEMATGLIQSSLQKQAGQTEQALTTIRRLYQESPANPAAIQGLLTLLQETKQWQELLSILSASKKHRVLSEKEMFSLQSLAATQMLASADTSAELKLYWKSLPKLVRKETDIVISYCKSLLRLDQHQKAEVSLRSAINRAWSDDLIAIYGQLVCEDPAVQLKHAESWLSEHPTNSALMLCMGRLAVQNKLWGMARSFLEIGVQNGDSDEIYLELAWLLESLDEPELALNTYRSGLERILRSGPKNFSIPDSTPIDVYEGEEIIADAVSLEKDEADQDNQPPSLAYSNESK